MQLLVYLDDLSTPVLIIEVDLSRYLYLEGGAAWIGLTATIGASLENHDILSWSFTHVLDPKPRVGHLYPQPNGMMLLDYPTLPGLRYRMQYSYDFLNWFESASTINGTGNAMSWLDLGPPETDKLPQNAAARYYRLRVVP